MAEMRLSWSDRPDAPDELDFIAARDDSAPDLPESNVVRAVAFRGTDPLARLAIYMREDLHGAPGRSGLIGHFAARDGECAVALLRDALRRLIHSGAVRVLGPMNGSTWARYRFALPALDGDLDEPVYLGEPVNPREYPAWFERAGLEPVALYESRVTRTLTQEDDRVRDAHRATVDRGLTIEPLDISNFDAALRELHALSAVAFAENRYYSPIAADAFVAQYAPFRAMLDPALVLLARDEHRVLRGVSFAYPDPLGAAAGSRRVVLKTLAVHPDWRSMGLGGLLVARTHQAASERGHHAVIHALMHVANHSVRISSHTSGVFRRYALFGRSATDVG